MMPNPDDDQYDELALEYFEQAIDYAYRLKKESKDNLEASFFLSAAYSFKSRIHADRGHWSRAIFAGRKALLYLRYVENWQELSPEWLLGEGLYNYYSVWIADNYTLMRPVIAMFKRGNKQTGLEQLEKARKESFFVRTEAEHFLMRIYRAEENQVGLAAVLAQRLAVDYPDNPYFQRYYVGCAYSIGMYGEAERVAQEILQKITLGMEGYEEVTGRHATYFLGEIYFKIYGNLTEAKRYYEMTVQYAEAIKAKDSGYYHYAMLGLAYIAERQQNYKLAKYYTDKVRKYSKRRSDEYKEAKKKGKEYKKKDWED